MLKPKNFRKDRIKLNNKPKSSKLISENLKLSKRSKRRTSRRKKKRSGRKLKLRKNLLSRGRKTFS